MGIKTNGKKKTGKTTYSPKKKVKKKRQITYKNRRENPIRKPLFIGTKRSNLSQK